MRRHTIYDICILLLILVIVLFTPVSPPPFYAAESNVRGFPYDFQAINSSHVMLREEWNSQELGSRLGQLDWSPLNNGNGRNRSLGGTWPHIAIIIQESQGAADDGNFLILSGNVSQYEMGALGSNAGWHNRIIFRLGQTTNSRMRIGFCRNTAAQATVADGYFLRYDTNASFGDTNFQYVSIDSGASNTTTNSGVAADTSWHQFDLRSITAGTLLYSLDGGSESAISTNVPTTDMHACLIMMNDTTASNALIEQDFWGFQATGVR